MSILSNRQKTTEQDWQIERSRYEEAGGRVPNHPTLDASDLVPIEQRAAVAALESAIRCHVSDQHCSIELGCGTGRHTSSLARASRCVVGVDYANSALKALRECGQWGPKVHTALADMSCTPFANSSFDVVLIATSLSYVESSTISAEIRRLLKHDGTLIILDSLRHNPIYKFNRYLNYRKGTRTFSQTKRIPSLRLINSMRSPFRDSTVLYFGQSLFLFPLFKRIVGPSRGAVFCEWLDNHLPHWMAFKFVLVATGFLKN